MLLITYLFNGKSILEIGSEVFVFLNKYIKYKSFLVLLLIDINVKARQVDT